MSKPRIAVYPGSFDPVTNGHTDIVRRASRLFDKVIVLVSVNAVKSPSFSSVERVKLITKVVDGLDLENVVVDIWDGLLVDYIKQVGAIAIIKGLRAVSDFEYEFQQALTNKQLNPDVETVFVTAGADYMYLSSSIVKQVCELGGDVSDFVPEQVLDDIVKGIRRKED